MIDELPSDFDFDVPLLPEESGPSQDLESHHLSRSFTGSEPGERGSWSGILDAGDIPHLPVDKEHQKGREEQILRNSKA